MGLWSRFQELLGAVQTIAEKVSGWVFSIFSFLGKVFVALFDLIVELIKWIADKI